MKGPKILIMIVILGWSEGTKDSDFDCDCRLR